ncbi:MAG: N-acetylmuramoyl-L-alanine amidase [Gemmatimonadaceae bacterium]
MQRAILTLLAGAVVAGCRPATAPRPEPVTPPEAIARGRGTLPPVPFAEGPLAPRVEYPRPEQMIQSRDSNFILGSVGNGRASLTINGQPVPVWPNGAFLAWVANPAPTARPAYELAATLGEETAWLTLPVRVAGMPIPDSVRLIPDSLRPPPPPPNVVTDTTPAWVVLGDSALAQSDTDRVIVGRPGPNSVYRWFLLPGTRAQVTARYPGFARIRLDSALQIWVAAEDARTFAADTARPVRVAGNARVRSHADWSDLIIPISERPAYFVEERENSLELTLYGTRGSTDQVAYPSADSLIKLVEWEQALTDRAVYSVRLSQPPFGYLVMYDNGALVLRVRRPPQPVTGSALAGLTIAVDAGHPPGGAVGPTGYLESDAVLPVAFALQRILEERGAAVFMTRTTRDAVDLGMRPIMARRAGAHAFVSLHYNAYGDGVNPFVQPNGMEVYFYRPRSEPLARAIQAYLLAYQPLPDQGVLFRSLAVVRTTWMPAVLAEGGFMMIPEQENAMRTPEFQERYASAVADGLEAYFRAVRSP